MPYARKTLSQLVQEVSANIDAELPGVDSLLRFAVLRVLAKVFAGAAWGTYGYLDWIAQQATPYTATDEYLEAWAALKDIARKPPTAWQGTIQFTGTPGAVIPDATPITRGDGFAYVSVGAVTVGGGGSATVAAQAVMAVTVSLGSQWNVANGVAMTFGIALSSVTSTGAVTATTVPGTDIETDDELRARMLEAFANPPQGGAKADYVEWATSVAGVTRAWCYPMERGPGTVTVRFMMDDLRATNNGFPIGTDGVATDETRDTPATGDQLTVANVIYDLRPVTPIVYLVAPLPNPVAFTIAGLSTAPAGVQSAVEAAIAGVFAQNGEPGGSVDVDLIEKAIGAVAGSSGFVITLISPAHGSVSPGSAGNITSNAGYLPTLGTVTWV